MEVELATENDIPALIALARHSGAATHWSEHQFEQIFRRQQDRAFSRLAFVIRLPEERDAARDTLNPGPSRLGGFLIARRLDREWELENIVVAESLRRNRLGELLLNRLLAHAQAEQGISVYLEVRETNLAAQALYRKLRFQQIGRRPEYYANPAEDAVLFRYSLTQAGQNEMHQP